MVGADFMDEVVCGSFFDQFEDFIDFPPDNECGLSSGGGNDLSSIWPNPSDSFPCSGLSAELSVPYEDIIPLEWLSNFVEDSFSGGGMTLNKENLTVNKESSHNQFKPSSPISVLESSSSSSSSSSSTGSCSGGMVLPIAATQHGPQRARSKRPRPATFNPRPAINLFSPTSVTENHQSVPVPLSFSESDNFVESPSCRRYTTSGCGSCRRACRSRLRRCTNLLPHPIVQHHPYHLLLVAAKGEHETLSLDSRSK